MTTVTMNRESGKAKNTDRQKVLVTGATGFLGGYLVRRLTSEYQVLALGRNRERGRQLEQMGAVFCPGDFTDRETCASYFKGVRYVIHAGALSTVWGKWQDFHSTNVEGTGLVAKLCLENKVSRLVYISSPSIYTSTEDRYNIREEDSLVYSNLNYYIKSKLMAETVIRSWNERGLETVILRPRGLIGIGDTSLVPRLLHANSRIGIPLMRSGHNVVDLTSVENVAVACRLALDAEEAKGETFNITNGEPIEFRTLLEHFLSSIGERPHYRRLPFQLVYTAAFFLECMYRSLGLKGEPPLTRYTVCTLGFSQTMDISKARKILGYCPEKTLVETIEEYGRWWKNRPKEQRERPQPPGMITRVQIYHCGYCTNNLSFLFRGRTSEQRNFPARAVLIQHREQGNMLFDTGYSHNVFQGGLLLRLYRFLNPVRLKPGESIAQQMKDGGISPKTVKTIIISHPHPDHIGGMCQFSGYDLVADKEVLRILEKPKLRALVFPNMIPDKRLIKSRRQPQNRLTDYFLCDYFDMVYDLFGDGSIIAAGLPGHSKGQLGIWIPDHKLFLAADACWGSDLMGDTLKMRWAARLIQNNFSQYTKTLRGLCRLKRDYPDIKIIFTHDKGREKTYE